MYHIYPTGMLKNNFAKVFVAVIALSTSVTAAYNLNHDQDSNEQRIARTARTKSCPQLSEAKKNPSATSSFLSELYLFLRVLSSGPFGLYSGLHRIKKQPTSHSFKPFKFDAPEIRHSTRKKPIRRHGKF